MTTTRITILYIDGNASDRGVNARRLRSRGFRVFTASSGAKGLARVDPDALDVVLCDLSLPDRDGLDVLRRMKTAAPDLPVIILTAQGSVSQARAAIQRGAYHFIVKPVEINDLEITIHQALEHGRLHRQLTEYSRTLERKVSERTERLEFANRQLTALNEAANRFSQLFREEELLDLIPELMTSTLDFDRSLLLLYQEGALRLRSLCWPYDPPERIENFRRNFVDPSSEQPPHILESITGNSTIFIPDLNADPRWPRQPNRVIRTKALVITPLRVHGEPVGVIIGNMQYHDREMDQQDIARVEMYATLAGSALEYIRAYQSLEDAVGERTTELQKLNRELNDRADRLERHREELAKANARLQALIDTSFSAIVMVGHDGRIVTTNLAVTEFFGIESSELIGQPVRNFHFRAESRFERRELYRELVMQLTEQPDDLSQEIFEPDQLYQRAFAILEPGRRVVSIFSFSVTGQDSTDYGRVWVYTDITRAKRADEQLRTIIDASPIPTIVSSIDTGRIIYANDHLGALVGLSARELIGQYTPDFYADPKDRAQVLERVARDGRIENYEVRLKRVDGSPFWSMLSVSTTRLGGEQVIIGGVYDISLRKSAEEALQAERNFVSAVLETVGALIVVLDSDGRIVRFNRSAEVVSGYSFAEVSGERITERLIAPEDQAYILDVYDAIVSSTGAVHGENDWVTRSGDRRRITWLNTALRSSGGDVEYIVATGIDITEQVEAQRKLQLYREIFDRANDAIAIFDRELLLVECNPAHSAAWGGGDETGLHRHLNDIIGAENAELIGRAIARDGAFRGEIVVRSEVREAFTLDLSVFTIECDEGGVLYYVGIGRDITARKEAEEALRAAHDELESRVEQRTAELARVNRELLESETQNRALLEAIPDLMFRVSREGIYLDYKAPKGSPLVIPKERVVGGHVRDHLPPPLAAITLESIDRALATGDMQRLEYDLPHEGTTHFFEARVVVSGEDEVLAIVRDITERKQAEEALRRAHDELEDRVQQRTAQLARVNQALSDEVRERRQAQEELGARLRYEEGLAAFSQALLSESESGDALREAMLYLVRSAHVGRVYVFENELDSDGRLWMRRIQEARESDVPTWRFMPDSGRYRYEDGLRRWAEELGHGREVVGPVSHLPEREAELLRREGIRSVLVLPITVENQWYGFIGFDDVLEERQWSQEDIRSLTTGAEMLGIYLERSRVAEALRISEERFRRLVENAADVIFSVDADCRVTYLSPNFTAATGYEVNDFIGSDLKALILDQDYERFKEEFRKPYRLGMSPAEIEIRVRHRDGSLRWLSAHGNPLKDAQGNVIDVIGVAHDVTELRRLLQDLERANREIRDTQTQLVQSEKMASLGMLVAGIAHEINTPIGAMSSMHDTLVRAVAKLKRSLQESPLEYERNPAMVAALNAIDDANRVIANGADRVTTIVRRLRSFARLDEAELKRADIHEGIEDTLTLIHHEIKHHITIERRYGSLPPFNHYPGRMNQVFLNLFNNARQAIRGAGTITVSTRTEGNAAVIEISDTGAGIPPHLMPRIFDPGFTTKGVGVGTGLGLSICYQIIQDHRGTITAASEPGTGTTFTIRLPMDLDDNRTTEGRSQ